MSPRKRRLRKRDFLGYCPKCGADVQVDFCDRCQMYVQPAADVARGEDGESASKKEEGT